MRRYVIKSGINIVSNSNEINYRYFIFYFNCECCVRAELLPQNGAESSY